jgi:tyrosinase
VSDSALSTWDLFVLWHWHAMTTPTGGGRNGAHRGPVFLPWHRWFLLELEAQFQRVLEDADFALPYWDWAADGDRPVAEQRTGPLWTRNAMGRSNAAGSVIDGPFSSESGFRVRLDHTQAQGLFATDRRLRRGLGQAVTTLPTSAQVDTIVDGQTVYDASPWSAATTSGFRNLAEGNLPFAPDSVAELHNRVHVWVGGDMLPPTSPNDPVFYLNHCNVDRQWARWQERHPAAGYRPTSGPPELQFHRRDDAMFRPFWQPATDPAVRPRDMLDVSARYTYDVL